MKRSEHKDHSGHLGRAEVRRAARRDRAIILEHTPIPDTHPLAFVRDYAQEFGLAAARRAIEVCAAGPDDAPSPVSLCDVTYLAVTRHGYDPLTAVVYHLDAHGVCTLRELAQVAVIDLPPRVRREKAYHVVHDPSRSLGDTTPTAGGALLVGEAPTGMRVVAEEGPEVIAAAPFAPTLAILTREGAQALFDEFAARPERLWPIAYGDRLEFLGTAGVGYTAATLGETLAYLPRHPPD